jgi:hypothetical protein
MAVGDCSGGVVAAPVLAVGGIFLAARAAKMKEAEKISYKQTMQSANEIRIPCSEELTAQLVK